MNHKKIFVLDLMNPKNIKKKQFGQWEHESCTKLSFPAAQCVVASRSQEGSPLPPFLHQQTTENPESIACPMNCECLPSPPQCVPHGQILSSKDRLCLSLWFFQRWFTSRAISGDFAMKKRAKSSLFACKMAIWAQFWPWLVFHEAKSR